jgi:CBS domain-containing protein/sporulation protein YlmC with PRC-barrel domain
MPYVSELTGKPVVDSEGITVGNLVDFVARIWGEVHHPSIEAIVLEHKKERRMVPFSSVVLLMPAVIPLNCRQAEIPSYTSSEEDIFLVEDVLDKQIIDVDGARVVRVNDLELIKVNANVFVSNVDIGGMGVLRRVGLSKLAGRITNRLHLKSPQNSISWDFVELLQRDQDMRLKVPGSKITELHPADLAEIISDMNRLESSQLLDTMDIKHIADALEEVEPDFQASLVKNMSDEKVADVLEEMAPDEAADLLGELSKERSEDLLDLMEDDEAKDVRKLLSYPDDSAGGLMTTEYAAVLPDLTAEQAIASLRESASEAETVFYVYVVDEIGHLLGVFSLSDLIFSKPQTPVAQFMHKRVVKVDQFDKQDEIAQVIAKYNLLSVPVVDGENILRGMVTSDDALDKIIPTAWKKRLPRFYY